MSLIGMMVDITKCLMVSKYFSYTDLNSKEHIYNMRYIHFTSKWKLPVTEICQYQMIFRIIIGGKQS